MSKPNDGGPAFPQPFLWESNKGPYGRYTQSCDVVEGGMSLRAWLAGMAMQGMLCHGFQPNQARENFGNTADFNYARAAVAMADALISELNKDKP